MISADSSHKHTHTHTHTHSEGDHTFSSEILNAFLEHIVKLPLINDSTLKLTFGKHLFHKSLRFYHQPVIESGKQAGRNSILKLTFGNH